VEMYGTRLDVRVLPCYDPGCVRLRRVGTNSAVDTSSHLILIPYSQLPGQEEQALSSRAASVSSWRGVIMTARFRLAVPLEVAFADDPKKRIYVSCPRSMTLVQTPEDSR
jgi:hypothetical protein